MTPRPIRSLANIDAGAMTLALLIAAGAIFFWLRPAFLTSQRVRALETEETTAQEDLRRIETEQSDVRKRIQVARRELDALGGGLPPVRELDSGIKQVLALAEQAGMGIEAFRPTEHRVRDHWQEYQFEIKAAGDFPMFHRFCRATEQKIAFVDIPSYALRRKLDDKEATAKIVCSVRFFFKLAPSS